MLNYFVESEDDVLQEELAEEGIHVVQYQIQIPATGEHTRGLIFDHDGFRAFLEMQDLHVESYTASFMQGLVIADIREGHGPNDTRYYDPPTGVIDTNLDYVEDDGEEELFEHADVPEDWPRAAKIAAIDPEQVHKFGLEVPKVQVTDWENRVSPSFYIDTIHNKIADQIGGDIILRFADETPTEFDLDSEFTIHIWSSANDEQKYETPEQVLGTFVTKGSRPFKPALNGKIFSDGTYDYAELIVDEDFVPRDFYIFHDCRSRVSSNERMLFQSIMQELSSFLSLSDEKKEHQIRLSCDPDYREQQIQNAFAENLKDVMQDGFEQLKSDLDNTRNRIQNLQDQLTNKIRKKRRLERQIKGFQGTEVQAYEEAEKEYRRICSHSKVQEAHMDNDRLVVHTHPLCFQRGDEDFYRFLGRMKLKIPVSTDTTASDMKMINKDQQVDGGHNNMHAPHVNNSGTACTGDLSDILPELIADAEYSVIVSVLVQFLETVNLDDHWGRKSDNWPEATEEQARLYN